MMARRPFEDPQPVTDYRLMRRRSTAILRTKQWKWKHERRHFRSDTGTLSASVRPESRVVAPQ